jgi:hypothetical protein
MQIISCSIDVSKIDKTRLIQGKNGSVYFNFDMIVNEEPDKYGKHASISISQTKDEREAKKPKTYLGNGKVVWKGESKKQVNSQSNDTTDSLPF